MWARDHGSKDFSEKPNYIGMGLLSSVVARQDRKKCLDARVELFQHLVLIVM